MASSSSCDNHEQSQSSSVQQPSLEAEEILIKNGRPVARLPPNHGLRSFTMGERIKGGRSILKVCNLLTPKEVDVLQKSCIAAADERKLSKDLVRRDGDEIVLEQGSEGKVFVRLLTQAAAERNDAIEDALPEPVSALLETILDRAFTFVDNDAACQSVKDILFGAGEDNNIARLFRDDKLEFSNREPAVNVYEAPHGQFVMHKDHHALSILIPLSDPTKDFTGGGTAFWSQSHPMEGMDGPSIVLKPAPGTALLWGGRVSHKGMRITGGTRVVIVASFSGPDSPPLEDVRDRLSAGLGARTILSGR